MRAADGLAVGGLLFGGVVLLTAGVAVGGPHLADEGWSGAGVAGAVAAVVGLAAFVVAARRLRPSGWPTRVVVGLGTLVVLALSLLTLGQALAVTWVPSSEIGRRPADVGLVAEDVHVRTADGVTLAGWFVPPHNGVAVVLAHGAGSTRSAVLDQAVVLVDAGYGVLAVDARGHGESGGRAMDLGWWGDEDVGAAVDFLADQPEVEHIAALGLSMGGEEVLGAAAADDRIEAVVAEGATVRVAGDKAWLSDAYGWRGALQEGLEQATTWFADGLTAADPPITLREAVRRASPRAVLLLTAGDVADEARAAEWIAGGSPDTVEVVGFPDAGHTAGLDEDPDRWASTVLGFLESAIPT